jgi:GNAT superfamily N-acetyltransferase
VKFTIRRATEADAGIIARQRMLMFRDMGEPAHAEETLERHSRAQIAEMLQRGDYYGWLAEVNGEIVAGVGMFLRTLMPRYGNLDARPEAYLCNVYTDPAHRRQGIAKALVEEVVAWCRREPVRRITLHASKYGQQLYEQLGFVEIIEMRKVLD